MNWIIILVLIYLVSAVLMYIYVKVAYSKGGVFGRYCKPSLFDVIITITPIVNSIAVFVSYFRFFPVDLERIDTSKFFGIRKQLK